MTPDIAVFDVNETTLDLTPVRDTVDDLLGMPTGFTIWFQRLLQLSMTTALTGDHVGFSTLAPAALTAVYRSVDRAQPDDAWERVSSAMGRIEPHPDVRPALVRLREGGWTTVALTNSTADQVSSELDRTDLSDLFDHVLSVDAVAAFKPAAAPYRLAAETVRADPDDMWMIACHDWDLAGARAVGMKTAFVERPTMSYAPTHPDPDLSVPDFGALATSLLDG